MKIKAILLSALFVFPIIAFSQNVQSTNYDVNTAVYIVVEKSASFNGGDLSKFKDWVSSQLVYPKEAEKRGIEGRAFIQFVINRNGAIEKIKVIRSSGNILLDEEALRVLGLSPQWKPAEQKGEFVNQQFLLPITFKLK